MKRIYPLIQPVLLLLLSLNSQAQEKSPVEHTLTLREAVTRALQNYPAIEIQQHAISRAEGLKTTAGIFPNPTLSYYREDLSLNSSNVGEWIVSGSLPLNFLWTRWSKVAAANQRVEAQRLLLADVRRQIAFEVQKAYVETHFAEQKLRAWQKATAVFDHAARAGYVRFTDGDLSGYDQKRIALEQVRYRKAVTEAEIKLHGSRTRLTFLVDPEQSELLIRTTEDFQMPMTDLGAKGVLTLARENRPDLQAAKATLRSKQSSLKANKWQAFPDVAAVAGYKEQLDNSKGSVFQINVSLPVFDRNQGSIKSARAELDEHIHATELLERKIALEAQQAYETVQLYRKQVEPFLAKRYASPDEFLETALFAYNEGEMSLLELLDGVRAYSESLQVQNDLLLHYHLSLFELQKATATGAEDL